MDTVHIIKIVTLLVMPPGCVVIVLLLGLALWRWWRRLSLALLILGTGLLYLSSVPFVAARLANSLEIYPALKEGQAAEFGAQAIVVLGGGRRMYAPEYGSPVVSGHALERLRYAAWLARRSGLPLAVTGGALVRGTTPEAKLMAKALEEDFGVPVRWVENKARNTAQNARNTATLLGREGIKKVVVLSHATHLPRATMMFNDAGMEVLPAPTAFLGDPHPEDVILGDFLPSARALMKTRLALHEHLGALWYRMGGSRGEK